MNHLGQKEGKYFPIKNMCIIEIFLLLDHVGENKAS